MKPMIKVAVMLGIAVSVLAVPATVPAATLLDVNFDNDYVGHQMVGTTSPPFFFAPATVGTIDASPNNYFGNAFESGVLTISNSVFGTGNGLNVSAIYGTPPEYKNPEVAFLPVSTVTAAQGPIKYTFNLAGVSGAQAGPDPQVLSPRNSSGQYLWELHLNPFNQGLKIVYGAGQTNALSYANNGSLFTFDYSIDLAGGSFGYEITKILGTTTNVFTAANLPFRTGLTSTNIASVFWGAYELGNWTLQLDNILIWDIPEPSTVLLLTTGIGVLAWRRRPTAKK